VRLVLGGEAERWDQAYRARLGRESAPQLSFGALVPRCAGSPRLPQQSLAKARPPLKNGSRQAGEQGSGP